MTQYFTSEQLLAVDCAPIFLRMLSMSAQTASKQELLQLDEGGDVGGCSSLPLENCTPE